MGTSRKIEPAAVDRYVEEVLGVLDGDFPDLVEPVVRGVAVHSLRGQATVPGAGFEFLLTRAGLARLQSDGSGGFRVADYAMHPSAARTARFEALNQTLTEARLRHLG